MGEVEQGSSPQQGEGLLGSLAEVEVGEGGRQEQKGRSLRGEERRSPGKLRSPLVRG